jgi:hypothetical protein
VPGGVPDDSVDETAALPPEAPGTTPRERLNLWYLTDAGQAELLTALSAGTYRIDVPEDAALMTVAWLLAHDHAATALDIAALRATQLVTKAGLDKRLSPAVDGLAAAIAGTSEGRRFLGWSVGPHWVHLRL